MSRISDDDFHRQKCRAAIALALSSAKFDITSTEKLREVVKDHREDRIRIKIAGHYPFGSAGNKTLRALWREEVDRVIERLALKPPPRETWPAPGSKWHMPNFVGVGTVSAVMKDAEGITRVVAFAGAKMLPAPTIQEFLESARPETSP